LASGGTITNKYSTQASLHKQAASQPGKTGFFITEIEIFDGMADFSRLKDHSSLEPQLAITVTSLALLSDLFSIDKRHTAKWQDKPGDRGCLRSLRNRSKD
jgi:hypothetical protein